MEAPEKIYIHPDIGGREFLRPWLHRPANNESVEYTRTDAFIEKACEWLRTHSEDDYFEQTPYNYCGAGTLNKKRMIEDFKKYMEDKL